MMNLFSSFDPSTNISSLNWTSNLLSLMILPIMMWIIPSRTSINFFLIYNYIYKEIKMLLNNKNKKSTIIFSALFMVIAMNNVTSLFPFIFSSSSHLSFSLTLSLPLWTSFLLYSITNNFKKMMIHLIPLKTPLLLMSFMVYIELISNIIRPLTLAIRLSANIIAGHLILTMLSSFLNQSFFIQLSIIIIQFLIMILEIAVSMIQAYVFSMLSTLYFKEMN